LRKQQWYKDFLAEESAERLPFIGKFGVDHNEKQIAADICQTFEINGDFRNQVTSWTGFLMAIIERAETLRILVLRSGIVKNSTRRKLSVDEFRGFVINDDIAPLIFLNGQDAKAAQIFTLVHELVHLWIGESGISNPDLSRRDLDQSPSIERFCNHVAAEILVPRDSFLSEWNASQNIRDNLIRLTRLFRVSSLVILRRAFDLQIIPWSRYIASYNLEKERYKQRQTDQQREGGNFYASLGARNSKQLTRAIISSAFEGRILYREAASLLNVKVESLQRVATEFGIR
ncbi:MAG: ImmA/IrrE family metallo-endopeptidase, partial [Acidiferrobacterales bacterium]